MTPNQGSTTQGHPEPDVGVKTARFKVQVFLGFLGCQTASDGAEAEAASVPVQMHGHIQAAASKSLCQRTTLLLLIKSCLTMMFPLIISKIEKFPCGTCFGLIPKPLIHAVKCKHAIFDCS